MLTTLKHAVPPPLRRIAHHARVKHAIRTFEPYETEHNYHGTPLRMWISDPMAADWYDRDYTDQDVLQWLAEQVPADGLAFDLGAHHGLYAMMIAERLVPHGRVVAVEAEAYNARVAQRNINLNGLRDRVEVVHAAAGDHNGTVRFAESLNGSVVTFRAGTVEVPMVTIDTLTDQYGPPDVVMIDVEGYEQRVLEGARRTLAEHAPALEVEVHADWQLQESGGTVRGVLELLDGYQLTGLDGQPYRPVEDRHHLIARR